MAWRRVRALERSWLDLESKRKVVVACRGGQLDQLGVRLLVPSQCLPPAQARDLSRVQVLLRDEGRNGFWM